MWWSRARGSGPRSARSRTRHRGYGSSGSSPPCATSASGPAYRGCPFINVAAEYPDPAHPVRQAIAEYRRRLRDLYRDLLAADDHPDPERTADMLLLLRDGLAVSFDLDDPTATRSRPADPRQGARPLVTPTHATPAAAPLPRQGYPAAGPGVGATPGGG